MSNIIGVIFSKDRSMQLDAALRSFYFHCQDEEEISLKVIYKASNSYFQAQYEQLTIAYPQTELIPETNFKQQLLTLIKDFSYILFLVDDNIFTRKFSLKQITGLLRQQPDTLGYSLRLGTNTTFCYMGSCSQQLPEFEVLDQFSLKFDWTTAEGDFAYPLELSSSVYRYSDMESFLNSLSFNNPNSLEDQMYKQRNIFCYNQKYLLCSQYSTSFCNPVNKVQQEFPTNRGAERIYYSIENLGRWFSEGYRININQYCGFIPESCHQEVPFVFNKEICEPSGAVPTIASTKDNIPFLNNDTLSLLYERGLFVRDSPFKLHLGCGEQHLDGYINIDFPPSHHNIMHVAADVFFDIKDLSFPSETIDEIRLHHVFEHFNRVTALALLIRWHSWLKIGGWLIIETPDLMGISQTIVSNAPYLQKMAAIRHLTGDQSDQWAYHVDHWFPERFQNTLELLGYRVIDINSSAWGKWPYLSNVTVKAEKINNLSLEKHFNQACQILWQSTVAPTEQLIYETWIDQLRKLLFAIN